MDHVNINEKFLRYLKRNHTGAGKASQSKSLEMRFQMSGRKIRDIVNTLRCDGHPICSDDGGYYYAANKGEILGSIRQLNSRIEKIAEAKNGLISSISLFPDSSRDAKLQIWFVNVDGNIDSGGGGLGQGNSNNRWSSSDEGVRVTVIRASDHAVVTTPIDITNKPPNSSIYNFGKVSKIQYSNGRSISPVKGGYICVKPKQAIPKIISINGKNNIEAIKKYFCSESIS